MASPEHTSAHRPLLSRRIFLGVSTALALEALLSKRTPIAYAQTRPAFSRDIWNSESLNPIVAKTELTTEMNQRFGIVFPESDVSDNQELLYPYANLHRALSLYATEGITNFSNDYSGNLHIVVSSRAQTLNGKTPFSPENTVGYYWNDGISQLVCNLPETGRARLGWIPNDNQAPVANIEACSNQITTLYSLHELYHSLQHRAIGPTERYNHSRALLTPGMQEFAKATGIVIVSSDQEIQEKTPWELKYEYQGVEPWMEDLGRFDWRFGNGTNPILEGSAVSISQFVWNRERFGARFPRHAIWAEQEIDRLKAA